MFQPNTVIVIGAGASCEFNLPAGEGLKSEIATKLNMMFENGMRQKNGDAEIMQTLLAHCHSTGEDINEYLKACHKIKDAMPQALSIDNFLDAHQDDNKINFCGKLAIAKCILEAERRSILMKPSHQPQIDATVYKSTWLIPFAQRLTEGFKTADVDHIFDNVSFICFNYDRCLENALSFILQNYYFMDLAKAAAIISGAKIYHPYGALGRLPWQLQSSSGVTCEFGGAFQAQQLIKIAVQIKTFTERVSDDDLINNIRSCYATAARLIFLGFGFHDLNMEVLSAKSQTSPEVYGTAMGLSTSEQLLSQQIIKKSLSASVITNMNIVPTTCSILFSEFGRAICMKQ